MSATESTPAPDAPEPEAATEEAMPTEAGAYVPRQIIDDDMGDALFAAYANSMVSIEDGQLVTGSVVRVDRDEVLLDIGYKSEGVIPSRELSIRNNVDPSEISQCWRLHRSPHPPEGR